MNKNWIGMAGFAMCTALAVGCSSQQAPHTALTEAQSEVSAAEARGAQDVPQASLHLKMAKDAIAEAETLMKDGENEKARAALERAHVDAKLAKSLATENQIKEQAQEQIDRVKSLEQANAQLVLHNYG
jgi:hypothetical protein